VETALRRRAVVRPGRVIEVCSPELPEGAVAEVIIILETPRTEPSSWPTDFFERFAGSLPDFPDEDRDGN
jgi:hypothetical protein